MAHPSFGHGRMCELTAPERVRHFLLSIQTTRRPHEDIPRRGDPGFRAGVGGSSRGGQPGATPAPRHSASWTTTATASGRRRLRRRLRRHHRRHHHRHRRLLLRRHRHHPPPPPPPPADFTADVVTETDLGGYTFEAVGCRTAWVIRRQSALIVGTQLWSIELDVHWCYAFGLVRTIDQEKFVSCCGPAWSFDRWLATSFDAAGGQSATLVRPGAVQVLDPLVPGRQGAVDPDRRPRRRHG